jgi:hypothetical protein
MEYRANSFYWRANDNLAEFVVSDVNMQRHIRKAAKKYTDIIIDEEPSEENDYCMLGLIPTEFIQFRVKTTKQFSPEERQKRSEQMRKINEQKKTNS